MNYRHELKHEITYGDMLCLRGRLNAVAYADAHGDHGKYHIRSLYFDNLYDKAFMEKINGVNCREKYRLRYYDGDTSVIHLEKKSKTNGLSCKQSVQVTAEQVTQILRGDVAWLQKSEEPLLREFYTKLVNQGLRPKTIVDYTREAFTYAPGNVRVTMDYDIRTGMYGLDFLNAECHASDYRESPDSRSEMGCIPAGLYPLCSPAWKSGHTELLEICGVPGV